MLIFVCVFVIFRAIFEIFRDFRGVGAVWGGAGRCRNMRINDENLEFRGCGFWVRSGRRGIASKVCGVCLWSKVRRKCLFLCVFSIFFAQFSRYFGNFEGSERFGEVPIGAKKYEKLDFRGCEFRARSRLRGIASKVCGVCLWSKVRQKCLFLCAFSLLFAHVS